MSSLRGTSIVLMTVPACFQMRTNFSVPRISTWSCFSGSCFSTSWSGLGGPGTWASALMRAMFVHTAVIRRNEMVTMRRSIIGIMLISESSDLLPFPPPPPTSTPAMLGSSAALARLDSDSRYDTSLGRFVPRISPTVVILRPLRPKNPRGAGPFAAPCAAQDDDSGGCSGVRNAGEVDLLPVGDDQVQDLHARLVDVVLEPLGLAVEDGEADEAEEGDDEPEGGAVH